MKKEFIVLAIIIVLLAGILLIHKKNNVNYTIPELDPIKEQEITKLVIKGPGKEITLEKNGDIWDIKPEGFKADAKKISSMISQLSKLSISALVSEQKHYQVYDLTDNKKISVKAFAGDKVVRSLDIGKPASSSRQTYILLTGDENVYQADGNIRDDFAQSRDRLRDMTVMAFDDDISSIAIVSGGKKLVLKKAAPSSDTNVTLEKSEPKKPEWVSNDGKTAVGSSLEETINTLRNLTCEHYIDGKDKDAMGVPVYTITLMGLKDYSISLFEKRKDNWYPALSSESNYPFYLSQWKAKKLMLDEKALFGDGKK